MDAGVARLTAGRDPAGIDPADAAEHIRHWGFLAHPDMPDGPGPAFLLVALRPTPTLEHYDPETIDYWVTERGRGERRILTHETRMPQTEDFAWGLIRLVDRLGVSNEYVTFGGHLDAALVDGTVVAAFTSPAPILRRGGHSQGMDPGVDAVGAFFGRLMVAVDFEPGFEAEFADADPLVRYAAFIRDGLSRRGRNGGAGLTDDELARLLRSEGQRIRTQAAEEWEAAGTLLAAATPGVTPRPRRPGEGQGSVRQREAVARRGR
jgi:hypothetical protein